MKNKYPIYVAIPIQYSFLTFISFKWSLPDNQNVKQTSPYSSFKLYWLIIYLYSFKFISHFLLL